MKHASSRDLFAYWNERRGHRRAPERGDIEPGAIRQVLGDAFILACDAARGHPVRLAGTRICALFCRELRGEAFIDLWAPASRSTLRDVLAIAAAESVGLVGGVSGRNADGSSLDLELLLLPLTYRRPHHARVIGVLAPLAACYWAGTSPLSGMTLGSHRFIGPAVGTVAAPLPRAAQSNGRAQHGFVVVDGGRT